MSSQNSAFAIPNAFAKFRFRNSALGVISWRSSASTTPSQKEMSSRSSAILLLRGISLWNSASKSRSGGNVMVKFRFRNSAQKRMSSRSYAIPLLWECLQEGLLPQLRSDGNVFTKFLLPQLRSDWNISWSSASAITLLRGVSSRCSLLQLRFVCNFFTQFRFHNATLEEMSREVLLPQFPSDGIPLQSSASLVPLYGNIFMKFHFCNSVLREMSLRKFHFRNSALGIGIVAKFCFHNPALQI